MKKIVILAVFVVALATLTACSGQITGTQVDDNQTNNKGSDFKRPDFGQPEGLPDIQGLASSVVGNEVTILKIEKPQFNEESKNKDDGDDSRNEKTIAMTGGSMPGMGGREMGEGRQDMDEDAKAQMLEKIKAMTTEEEIVLIPVGIQMLKPDISSDTEKNTVVEASLEDIEKDAMLQIWLNEDIADRKVAKFVLIMK